jgi:hypothetical protein
VTDEYDINERFKEWAVFTWREYKDVVYALLFGSKTERDFALCLFTVAHFDQTGLHKDIKPLTVQKIPTYAEYYKDNWERIDRDLRFGSPTEQFWAAIVKQKALGMTDKEIEQDKKKRSVWVPYDQKRKGNW